MNTNYDLVIESFISYCDNMMIAEEASDSTFKERFKNTFSRRKSENNYLPEFRFAGVPVEFKIDGSDIGTLDRGEKKRLGRYFKNAMSQFQQRHRDLLKKAINSLVTELSCTPKSLLSEIDVARVVIIGDGNEDYRVWKSSNREYNIIVYYVFKRDEKNALRVGYSMVVTYEARPGYQFGNNGGAYVSMETKVSTDISTKMIKVSEINTDI